MSYINRINLIFGVIILIYLVGIGYIIFLDNSKRAECLSKGAINISSGLTRYCVQVVK